MKLDLMVRGAASAVVLVSCNHAPPSTVNGNEAAGGTLAATTSSTVSAGPNASSGAGPTERTRRPPPPPLPSNAAPFDFSALTKTLNPYHPDHGMIHATADGGCHVYLRDGSPRPPGSFPPPTAVACPASMLAPEWGNCVGSGVLRSDEEGSLCVCLPGDGDPPPPAFVVPCPH